MRSSSSSESVKRYWRIGAFVLIVALLAVGAAFAAPAAMAGSGAIEGTVTAANTLPAVPLLNIAVVAIPVSYDGEVDDLNLEAGLDARLNVAYTDANGHYFLNGIPEGVYHVKFFDPTRHPAQWAVQWFSGVNWWLGMPAAAADVYVVRNLVTPNIDASLYISSDISGTVHDWAGYPLGGIQVWPYYDGLRRGHDEVSWTEFVSAIESGRYNGYGRPGGEDLANDTRPRLPEWVLDNMTYTASDGYYRIGNLQPANGTIAPGGYKVYFHDPEKYWAPEWWDDNAPWDQGDLVVVNPGEDTSSVDETLSASGSIDGFVNGDLGDGYEYDLEGVEVSVYYPLGEPFLPDADFSHGLLLGHTHTDYNGYYDIDGLAATPIMGAGYTVVFEVDSHKEPYYRHIEWNVEVHPTDHTELCALLKPIPYVKWVHPPFGVNDGPNRYTTEIAFGGWGLNYVDVWLVKQDAPNKGWTISLGTGNMLRLWTNSTYDGGAILNLAAPLAPTGTYELHWGWYTPWQHVEEEYIDNAFQVVNSYIAPQPVTPAPTIPTLPATPTPITPVVTPTPEPTPPAPVAGAITVAAPYKAVVKHGQKATLRFRVNEAVLGGSAAVKITITNSKGSVVKRVAVKSVAMNAEATVSFTCNFAKGAYKFSVSATSAAGAASQNTASNTLTVK